MDIDGMVPDGVEVLESELSNAETALDSVGGELWNLLRHAGLATTQADIIRQIAGWAGQQIPDIHRRVVLLERIVAHDPAVQPGQPVFVNSEIFAPGKPLPTVGGFWDRLGQGIRSAFDFDQNSGNQAAEVAKGAWESTTGFMRWLWETSPARKTIDPDGWQHQMEDSARGVLYGIRNPLETLKAIVDWDTWATNPDRAFGRLLPDLLASAATAGGASGASAASRVPRALEKITRLLEKAKARVGKQVAPPRITPEGGWKWKGVELDPRVNAMADQALVRARAAEPQISRGVKAAAADVRAEMAGFPDHVLKGSDRFKEKLAKLTDEFPTRTPESLIKDKVHDSIRYTFTFDDTRYVKGVADVKAAMERQGFKLVQQKPSWGDHRRYKGVNTRWRGPDGQLFELQIHTPESLWAKEVTHEIYEFKRNLTPEDRKLLEKYEEQIFEAVPVPPGADRIPAIVEGG
ncbi:Phage protein [[Actinomadura] parvosata subsp. kistnae]|uniref:RelA/SpoT domain-containing protein n=1 Tax=[Actinomadura] parvosata subsp. kistnae TaxID=1909395 RepID=A0A1V0AED1_9ACTN|nr:hypothetical protein [Nonomuraea sp. ATCC 55076]AQZ68543.1 hypothetical protein BKM31_50045 [Nonomuraea sp. ATCC 55076]SPL92993.1 Phage protein [Actinomadura parvosata subsp. kistnae]